MLLSLQSHICILLRDDELQAGEARQADRFDDHRHFQLVTTGGERAGHIRAQGDLVLAIRHGCCITLGNQVATGIEDQVFDAGNIIGRVRLVLEGHEDIEDSFAAGINLSWAIQLDRGNLGLAKVRPFVSQVGEVGIALQGDGLLDREDPVQVERTGAQPEVAALFVPCRQVGVAGRGFFSSDVLAQRGSIGDVGLGQVGIQVDP